MADSRPEEKAQGGLIRWGRAITAVWLVGMLVGFAHFGKFGDLDQADKLGSFLQGLFALLAFGWLVIAVLLQTRALAQNREALLLQAEELRKFAEQSTAQTKLWQEERQLRGRGEDERRLNVLASDLYAKLLRASDDFVLAPSSKSSKVSIIGNRVDLSTYEGAFRTPDGYVKIVNSLEVFLGNKARYARGFYGPGNLDVVKNILYELRRLQKDADELNSSIFTTRLEMSGMFDLTRNLADAISFSETLTAK